MRVHVISHERWAAQGVAATLLRGPHAPLPQVTTGLPGGPAPGIADMPDLLLMVAIDERTTADTLALWPDDLPLLWLGPSTDMAALARLLATQVQRPFGCLPADVDDARLNAAVTALTLGLSIVDPGGPLRQGAAHADAAGAAHASPARQPPPLSLQDPLTQRELEVFELLAKGLGNRDIAGALGISTHTAKFHVGQILDKTGAATRTEAVRQGLRLGLVGL